MTKPTPHDREAGAATVWMVFATVIVFAVAGLVYDGGNLISATRAAINDAEAAARAGAQAVDIAAVFAGDTTIRLDPVAAEAQAQRFLSANGWTGTVSADTTSVTVTVIRPQPLTFLQALGVGERTVRGTATAAAHHDPADR
jgi:hypothetical protein